MALAQSPPGRLGRVDCYIGWGELPVAVGVTDFGVDRYVRYLEAAKGFSHSATHPLLHLVTRSLTHSLAHSLTN
jgi:hypothetical protein